MNVIINQDGTSRMHPAESIASHVRLPGLMELQGVGLRSQYPVERNWALGLQVLICFSEFKHLKVFKKICLV